MGHVELRAWGKGPCICYECTRPRKFSWMMKVRRTTVAAGWTGESFPTISNWEDFGIEFIRDQPAAYDDGRTFVVLETVHELEWAVVDTRDMGTMKVKKLSFDEAVEWCKLLNDSEEKNDRQ